MINEFISGRKRSHSPSPSRNASPNRSLSPSTTRARDRSISPLRYINLPISKLARVTEELESIISQTPSTLHEEEEEEQHQHQQQQQKEEEKDESIKLPEEIPLLNQQVEFPITKIIEPEKNVVLPQLSFPETTANIIQDQKSDLTKIEVSKQNCFYKLKVL